MTNIKPPIVLPASFLHFVKFFSIQIHPARTKNKFRLTEKMTESNTGLDSAYVKEQLGDVLTVLLSELVQVQPSDPIEWLANALRQHARGQSVSVL